MGRCEETICGTRRLEVNGADFSSNDEDNRLLEFGDLEEMGKEILLVFVGSCCFIWSCVNRKIFV